MRLRADQEAQNVPTVRRPDPLDRYRVGRERSARRIKGVLTRQQPAGQAAT